MLIGIVAALAGDKQTTETGVPPRDCRIRNRGERRHPRLDRRGPTVLGRRRVPSAELASLTEPQSAIKSVESTVAQAPECDLLWFKLSQGARAAARAASDPVVRRQMNDRARSAQQAAIDLVPEHPGHRAHFARLLFELSRGAATPDDVSGTFQQALRRDPNNPTLLGEAAHAAWARGDSLFARECLSQAIELDPNQANLRAERTHGHDRRSF